MLDLCLNTANMDNNNITIKNFISKGLFIINTAIGAAKADEIEDKDIYLVVIATIINTIKVITAEGQWIDDQIPKEVAIPLPPLKLKKMGQLCPITAKRPAVNLPS